MESPDARNNASAGDQAWRSAGFAIAAIGRRARDTEIWSAEYSAEKTRNGQNDHTRHVSQATRRSTARRTPRPVLFLVHGSSISARSSFDLAVPGHGEYSTMNVLRARGLRRLDDGP